MAFLGFDYEHHMKNTQFLRNICILAHVDHGKTTFSDYLIASNGIISQRDVGKIHYLDCREDEQLKQITMKSSCITLLYSTTDYLSTSQCFLINLIDTPGHVDFSAEVKTAVGLSDGAFLLIDVVEGICPQTRSAMKQIYLERLCPCLVINKIDKLIVNMGLNPLEAYNHIFQLIEQINAVMAGFNTFHEFEGDLHSSEKGNLSLFSPLECNIIFISSLDGWGFNLETFTNFFSNELGYSKKILSKTLWGDYYISHKAQRILPNAHAKGKWPLFASLILDAIWSIYRIAYLETNVSSITKLVKKLRLNVAFKEYKNSKNRQLLKSIFNQWLPLSKAALDMAVSKMPGPRELSDLRIERLLTNYTYQSFSSLPIDVKYLKHHFKSCKFEQNIPQIAYISKMMSFKRKVTSEFDASTAKEVDKHNPSYPPDNSDFTLSNFSSDSYSIVAIARVFSGTLFRGQMLYILHPQYDPKDIKLELQECLKETLLQAELPPNVSIVKISELYLLMGGELINVESVPAGNICGVYGLDKILLKNGTLSNTLHCIPFTPLYYITPPILKVAVEPIQVSQLDYLVRGINLLAQADPCVQTSVEESGEYVIYCAGEVHLQKCIEDLTKNFAIGIDFEVSAPIISFRETVISIQDLEQCKSLICNQPSNLKLLPNNPYDNIYTNSTPNKKFEISMTVRSIPTDVVHFLEGNIRVIRLINSINAQREISHFHIREDELHTLKIFKSRLNELMLLAGDEWINAVNNIWSFGPKMVGPNILLNFSKDNLGISIWPTILNDNEPFSQSFYSNIIHGFQLATFQGPLCNEPLVGVCFIISNFEYTENPITITKNESRADITKLEIKITNNAVYGPLSGQIISTVVKTCKQALEDKPIRLMRAMFSCSIQCSQDVLGCVIGVINRRGGKCLDQSIQVGTNLFLLETCIPVAESIGFSDEIRKKTSGLAIPQLMFSHWEVLIDDPFWVPTTEDELLHFGEKGDSENIAKKYVDSIRKRKGLLVKSNIVQSAEKQRTVKK